MVSIVPYLDIGNFADYDGKSNESVDMFLEIHFDDKKVEKFEIVEYVRKKYILNTKNDYLRLKNLLTSWLEENEVQSDKQYQNWVDEKIYCSDDKDNGENLINQLKNLQENIQTVGIIAENPENPKVVLDSVKSKQDQSETEENHKDDDNVSTTLSEKLKQEKDDIQKKKNKKRRTRKDRRKKEQVTQLLKDEMDKIIREWDNFDAVFDKEITRHLKKPGTIISYNGKSYTRTVKDNEDIIHSIFMGGNTNEISFMKIKFKNGLVFFGVSRINSAGKIIDPEIGNYYGECSQLYDKKNDLFVKVNAGSNGIYHYQSGEKVIGKNGQCGAGYKRYEDYAKMIIDKCYENLKLYENILGGSTVTSRDNFFRKCY